MNCKGAELVVILKLQRKDKAEKISRLNAKKLKPEHKE